MRYIARVSRVDRILFACAGLVLVASCTSKQDEPRPCLKDAATGELPVVAMWGAASTAPLLAVWSNGDVVWEDGLVRSGDVKSGSLSAADLDSLLANLESSLAIYEDTPQEFAAAHGPFVRFAYRVGAKTRWFTTLHTFPYERSTVVSSRRATEYVGTDPSVRARYVASIPAADRAFETAWDHEINSLSERLASVHEPAHLPRKAVATDWQ